MRTNSKLLFFYIFFIFTFCGNSLYAQEERNYLSKQLTTDKYNGEITTSFFPSKNEISEKIKNLSQEEQDKILTKAESIKNKAWNNIPVTAYLAFKRTGDRNIMQTPQDSKTAKLKTLVLAELLENKGNYTDAIMNGVWSLCEQTTWVRSAHLTAQKGGIGAPNVEEPIIDLGAGEISSLLAWTFYLFKDEFKSISPYVYNRIPLEINKRIITPYLERNDFWWMAFRKVAFVNNWNPWCNYNVLLSTALLGEEVSVETQEEVLTKSLKSLDKFINYYKDDGACEEGPGYWSHAGGKMLEHLELAYNITNKNISLKENDLIKKMGLYIMDANIEKNYFTNFSDATINVNPNPTLVYRYGKYIESEELKEFASYLAPNNDYYNNITRGSIDQVIHNLFTQEDLKNTKPEKTNTPFFFYKDNEIIGGRTSTKESDGFFFAAIGAHNKQSHNHNDVGSFILYHEGKPLISDIGIETYSRKTFSSKRYDIWTMQSNYHNVPQINGMAQLAGKKYKATNVSFKNTESQLSFNLNIEKAYPDSTMCNSFKRNYILKRERKGALIINDNYQLSEYISPTKSHFITAIKPTISSPGKIFLNEDVTLAYPENTFIATIETLPLEDKKLRNDWKQDNLYRITLSTKNKNLNENYTIKIYEN
ncbi:heparinase II/III domain-containing protein [Joostella sp. CR20]|uniref:heparinase II/III domain-containing protein n=1 Tax=Joostella sp. CR20 TaxID=2804312 RepID=UPI00313B2A80